MPLLEQIERLIPRYNMKTFEEWIAENHPEAIEEGLLKNLAISGAMLGASCGVMGCNQSQPAPQTKPVSRYQQAFGHSKADAQRLRQKASILRQQGRTHGTFTHGELD
jgi:hypothetical protein